MLSPKVIFNYNCIKTVIECKNNEKLEDIIKRFKAKRGLQTENLFFVKDAKEVQKKSTFQNIINPFEKEENSINILVFEKNLDNESRIVDNEKDQNQNEDFDNEIPKMKNDIIELRRNFGLIKLHKQQIQTLQIELQELKHKFEQKENLKEQIKKNEIINNSLLKEIKSNTKRNDEILEEIKNNININNQIKEEIQINKNAKSKLGRYRNELFQNQNMKNTTFSCSEKLQNYKIGNSLNSFVKLQNDEKIYSNIIFTRGMIIAWFGESLNIPKDWAICDGTKGTPDLRNRFIIGQSQEISFGSIGGSSSIVLSKSNLPQLGCGRFSADSHRGDYHHSNNGFIRYNGYYSTYIKKSKNGDDWGSNYEIDLNTGMDSSPINIMNPYLALFYIMKL